MLEIKNKKLIEKVIQRYVESGAYIEEVMLFGIQNESNKKEDKINDVIGIIFKDKMFLMRGTTNPGKFYIENPLNKEGAFQLGYGYHSKIWAVDKHKGKYEALCNRWFKGCKKTRGWRDTNKTFTFEESQDKVVSGHFGVNLHRMSKHYLVNNIEKYSAGCQVVWDGLDFDKLMSMIKSSDMYLKNPLPTLFSYYLFRKEEMEEIYNEVYK